jgi:HSP20 family protein
MRLIPYEWRNPDNWRQDMERFLGPLAQGITSPRIDILETETELVAVCEIPGIEKKEDIHIEVSENVLTIRGNIRRWREITDKALRRQERYAGSFSRSVELPLPIAADEIRASYRNGLLEVHMPKSEEPRGKQIDIDFN